MKVRASRPATVCEECQPLVVRAAWRCTSGHELVWDYCAYHESILDRGQRGWVNCSVCGDRNTLMEAVRLKVAS